MGHVRADASCLRTGAGTWPLSSWGPRPRRCFAARRARVERDCPLCVIGSSHTLARVMPIPSVVGISDFETPCELGCTYVDKTGFIVELRTGLGRSCCCRGCGGSARPLECRTLRSLAEKPHKGRPPSQSKTATLPAGRSGDLSDILSDQIRSEGWQTRTDRGTLVTGNSGVRASFWFAAASRSGRQVAPWRGCRAGGIHGLPKEWVEWGLDRDEVGRRAGAQVRRACRGPPGRVLDGGGVCRRPGAQAGRAGHRGRPDLFFRA